MRRVREAIANTLDHTSLRDALEPGPGEAAHAAAELAAN